MAFISGPRQVGKTTMAKNMLLKRGVGHYYNWDETKFRRVWSQDPSSTIPISGVKKPLVIYDEIHKVKLWKRTIKGIYDTLERPCDILVTGSARLDVYRKGSDSLLGRYHHFRLHPFSLHEVVSNKNAFVPGQLLEALFQRSKRSQKAHGECIRQLFEFGPFPEPFVSQSKRKLTLWQRTRLERLVREDLRDISRLQELSQVELLAALLPERVASPLSINGLSRDLEAAYNTVKLWLDYLRSLYYCYEVKPYFKSLPRSIKKEGKLYLWDWSEVEDEGARFENMVGSHLLKYCHFLHDTGYGAFDLRYVRNKEKKEIDFLLLKDRRPWFPVEVKLSDDKPSPNWDIFMPYLGCKKAIQVTMAHGVYQIHRRDGYELLIISADNFFQYLA